MSDNTLEIMEPMHVGRYRLKDWKSIPELEIKPPPGAAIVLVKAMNAGGKTSVLEGLMTGFGGLAYAPKEPVRAGETTYEIEIEFGPFIAKREGTNDNSKASLDLRRRDGLKVDQAPATFLKNFFTPLSFDAFRFANEKDSDRILTIKRLLNLDWQDLDDKYNILYHTRTTANQEVERAKHEFEKLTWDDRAPKEEVSIASLTEKMQKRAEQNAENGLVRSEAAQADTKLAAMDQAINSKAEKVADLKKQLAETEAEHEDMRAKREAFAAKAREVKIAAELLTDDDLSDIQTEIKQIQDSNEGYRRNLKYFESQEELERRKFASQTLTNQIEEVRAEKLRRIDGAPWPVPGMMFKLDEKERPELFYHGIPFDQASTAEKLRVSLAMGFAMNPSLKVMLIRDGSLLDSDSFKIILDMAVKNNAQVWIEIVDESPSLSIEFLDNQGNKIAA